jgi:hypothetical protein
MVLMDVDDAVFGFGTSSRSARRISPFDQSGHRDHQRGHRRLFWNLHNLARMMRPRIFSQLQYFLHMWLPKYTARCVGCK